MFGASAVGVTAERWGFIGHFVHLLKKIIAEFEGFGKSTQPLESLTGLNSTETTESGALLSQISGSRGVWITKAAKGREGHENLLADRTSFRVFRVLS
jgi:hypothetical protein